MGRIVIGFGYKRRRGKDTAARYAVDYLNSKADNVARLDYFAYSLKEGIGKEVFGFTDAQLYGNLKTVEDEFWGFTPRWALQIVGTEAMRNNVDPDIWTKTVFRRFRKDPRHVIISDVRFKNEVEMVKKMGGYVVHLTRPVDHDESQDFHASETGLDGFHDWDFTIDNHGPLDALRAEVHCIINEVECRVSRPSDASNR